MRFPSSWIESLFGRLAVRYGSAFMAQYRDVDIEAVKADWSNMLEFYADKPECIRQALEWLPEDKPPNAGQFRALCREAAPKNEPMAISHSSAPADPERVRQLVAEIMDRPADKRTLNQQLLARLYEFKNPGRVQREAIKLCEAYEKRGGPPL